MVCYFHVLQNLKRNLPKNKYKDQLINDINTISSSYDDIMFDQSVELFIMKWSLIGDAIIDKFIKYFQEYYVKRYRFWYYGAVVGIPTTNNGIEGTNSAIKSQHTLRKRLPLKDFLLVLCSLVQNWSFDRNPKCQNYKEFANNHTPSTKQWCLAFDWVNSNYPILNALNDTGSNNYILTKFLDKDESIIKINSYIAKINKWSTFEEFSSFRNGLIVVTEKFNSPSIFNCNCLLFLKNNSCVHSLGFMIRYDKSVIPDEAKCVVVGGKSKRGRRGLAKKALVRQ